MIAGVFNSRAESNEDEKSDNMNKDKLKKLANDPRLISGIYNYCDRWCERCPFTSRCLNFAMGEEDGDNPELQDHNSDVFWQRFESSLGLAMELLTELAEKQGIDLNETDDDETITHQEERNRQAAESHEISRAAKEYIKLADSWFKKSRRLFKERQHDMKTELKMGLGIKKVLREADSIVDVTEVIGWYQHQIYIKIIRAFMGSDLEEWEDELQNDSNGSAKVALIGIDRSIAAWAKLIDHFPEQSDNILDLLLHLDRLRKKTEKIFPKARAFKRPGFDKPI
jgi:hypothetical protein